MFVSTRSLHSDLPRGSARGDSPPWLSLLCCSRPRVHAGLCGRRARSGRGEVAHTATDILCPTAYQGWALQTLHQPLDLTCWLKNRNQVQQTLEYCHFIQLCTNADEKKRKPIPSQVTVCVEGMRSRRVWVGLLPHPKRCTCGGLARPHCPRVRGCGCVRRALRGKGSFPGWGPARPCLRLSGEAPPILHPVLE